MSDPLHVALLVAAAFVAGALNAMTVAATAGGYLGARAARRIPPPMLRAAIVATGLVMTVLFFLR